MAQRRVLIEQTRRRLQMLEMTLAAGMTRGAQQRQADRAKVAERLQQVRAGLQERMRPLEAKLAELEARYRDANIAFRQMMAPLFAKPGGDFAVLQRGPIAAQVTAGQVRADWVDERGAQVIQGEIAFLGDTIAPHAAGAPALPDGCQLQDRSERHIAFFVGPFQVMLTVIDPAYEGVEKVSAMAAALLDLEALAALGRQMDEKMKAHEAGAQEPTALHR